MHGKKKKGDYAWEEERKGIVHAMQTTLGKESLRCVLDFPHC